VSVSPVEPTSPSPSPEPIGVSGLVRLGSPTHGSFLVRGVYPNVHSPCLHAERPRLTARYPGTLAVRRADDGTLSLVVTLSFESYLRGIAEVPPSWPAAGWLNHSATYRTETGLAANTEYTRKVRAWNGSLNSAYSSTVSACTLSRAPGAAYVTADHASPCVGDSVTWTAVGGFGPGTVESYLYAWDQPITSGECSSIAPAVINS
jgi:hypothetical protein